MNETTVDARGRLCPEPLILTKKALGALAEGQQMTVLIDNETSKENVCRFLADNGADADCAEAEGVFTIRVTKRTDQAPDANVEDYCPPTAAPKPHVIAFSNDKMGTGPDELGQILIKAFVNTIGETTPLPGAMVFYNNGIHLACEGSPVVNLLRELESRGVQILVCGACLEYYDKKEQLAAGTVSNMYDILQTMTTAGHVIAP